MYRLFVIALLLSLGPAIFAADVYKTIDENGRVIYTDKPPPGQKAEKVDLPSVNTMPATTPRAPERRPDTTDDSLPRAYEVAIVSPEPESQVNPGQRDLTIQVGTNPPLHSRHQVIILDNGKAIATGTSTTIENIFRGTHSIQARVLDQQGRVIGQSEAIRVYVHRPTVNNPARR